MLHPRSLRKLKVAKIYVSTSFSHGSSASLLEAMACKLPPVVTAIPGNQEWISKNEKIYNTFLSKIEKAFEKFFSKH